MVHKVTECGFIKTMEMRPCQLDNALLPHSHAEGQLLFVPKGFIKLQTKDGHFTSVGDQAIWVPGQVMHQGVFGLHAEVQNIYTPIGIRMKMRPKTSLLRVPTLLREMLTHTMQQANEGATISTAMQQALVEQISDAPLIDHAISLPVDKRAALIADAILNNPANHLTLEEWGNKVGASSRTLMRIFAKETGHSFREWRAMVRVKKAEELITQGWTITNASLEVGYESLSAFNTARKLYSV